MIARALLFGALLAFAPAVLAVDDPVLARIDALVTQVFYSPDVLRERDWPAHVRRAGHELTRARDSDARTAVFARLLASLHTSHTDYLPRSDPRHADLAAIFERVLASSDHCPSVARARAQSPPRVGIGVWWRRIDGVWFVAGMFDQGVAQLAGLRVGDEVRTAGDKPFAPVDSFAGHEGKPVQLGIRRDRRGPAIAVAVVPHAEQPLELHAAATRDSAKIIDRGDARIAYVHLWSGVGDSPAMARDAIRTLNAQSPDAWIIDLRDGWGGVPPDFISIFDTRVPALVTRPRVGEPFFFDGQVRVPAVVVVNEGVRSGKEVLAHAIAKHHLATIVGSPTPGALVAGTAYCLPDGALLYLAVGTTTIDGEVLEGHGVQPDVAVPFDVRWANGADPQLDAALDLLAQRRTKATAK